MRVWNPNIGDEGQYQRMKDNVLVCKWGPNFTGCVTTSPTPGHFEYFTGDVTSGGGRGCAHVGSIAITVS